MTDKLYCPFCGAKLLGNMTTPYCPNPSCNHFSFPMPSEIWQAIIDGKKAQDKLDKVDTMLFSLVLKAHDLTALDLLQGITDIRLEIIKSITKQGE